MGIDKEGTDERIAAQGRDVSGRRGRALPCGALRGGLVLQDDKALELVVGTDTELGAGKQGDAGALRMTLVGVLRLKGRTADLDKNL